MLHTRSSGILLPIFSLPSPYGIGTLGKEAYEFVDCLSRSKQRFWQLLPIGPTGYGDSPYQSFSSFGGNPYFIDLRVLQNEGLLVGEEYEGLEWGEDPCTISYEKLYETRFKVLKIAFERFIGNESNRGCDFRSFCKEQEWWLENYALYMAIKNSHQMRPLQEWEPSLKKAEAPQVAEQKYSLRANIEFYKFVQYKFFQQWYALKAYANSKGIALVGDLPIYVSADSADVWGEPKLFDLDDELFPTMVAGVPPDGFTDEGQVWGNPLYNWGYHRATNYNWWTKRISQMLSVYDVLRIDHFRGFDSYYAIPPHNTNAKDGVWLDGPKMELFSALGSALGKNLPIIAEDLGFLTPAVHQLLEESGFPGMVVLQFAFGGGSGNIYLPHNHKKNSVVYTGTHDNPTTSHWLVTAEQDVARHVRDYLGSLEGESAVWSLIRAAMASVANTCIIPMGDFLELGAEGRINTPATTHGNWSFRLKTPIPKELEEKIAHITQLYGRENPYQS